MEGATVAQCQNCKAQLVITASGSGALSEGSGPASSAKSSRLEESFFLLDETLGGRHQLAGVRSGGMEESFVVLQQGSGRPGGGQQAEDSGRTFNFVERYQAVARVFELASEEAKVDQPLCTHCVAEVQLELGKQVAEAQAEAEAYEALGRHLRAEAAEQETAGTSGSTLGVSSPLEERDFQRQLRKAQEEVRAERQHLARAQAELAAAEAELRSLQQSSARLDAVEMRYWHAANALSLSLAAAVDERDSLAHRIEATERALATLRRTNVLSDIFRIWHVGPFGTIAGLRLGRTQDVPVEWEEINAAWGQAVLLLDCLARKLSVQFTGIRLEPRGSYPRLHDSRGVAELYGPVSKILCPSYDRAQAGFLACLKEFADVLRARGATEEGQPFVLPYAIEGDRISPVQYSREPFAGLSIRYALSRDKAWTRALKLMLVDLKFCIKGMLSLVDGRGVAAAVAGLPREGPSG